MPFNRLQCALFPARFYFLLFDFLASVEWILRRRGDFLFRTQGGFGAATSPATFLLSVR